MPCPCSQTHPLSLILGTSLRLSLSRQCQDRKGTKSGGLANSLSVFRLESSSPRATWRGNFLSKVAWFMVYLTPYGLFYRRAFLPEVQSFGICAVPLYLAEESFRIGLPTSLLRPEGSTRENGKGRANWEGGRERGSPKWKITANKRAFVLTVAGRAHCSGGFGNEKVGRIEGESREQSVVQIYGSVSFQNGGHNGPVFISLSAARYHKHPSLRVDVLQSDQTNSIFLIEEPF